MTDDLARVAEATVKLGVCRRASLQNLTGFGKLTVPHKGFRIALDDFGTGYSNLAYISRLPVTTIKIDRSFVTGLAVDKGALPLVKGIIALAKFLEPQVICEGIETTEQRELLEGTDCDSIQGYLISRPMPPETFRTTFFNRSIH